MASSELLGEMGVRKAIPGLIKLLKDENENVRLSAVKALIKLEAVEAIPELLKLLNPNENVYVLQSAGDGLCHLMARDVILELMQLLKSDNRTVRWWAVRILGRIGAREAMPEMTKLLNSDVADSVREAFVYLQPRENVSNLEYTDLSIPEVIKLLDANDAIVRWRAVLTIKKSEATEAIPTLTKLLCDRNKRVQATAAEALAELGDKNSIPELWKLLGNDQWEVHLSAAYALAKLGVVETITEIEKMISNGYWLARMSAIESLAEIDAKTAAPYALNLLNDKDQLVRAMAAIILAESGVKDKVPQSNVKDIQGLLEMGWFGEDLNKRAREALKLYE